MSLLDDDSDEEEIRIEKRRKSQKKTPSYKKRLEDRRKKSDFRNNNLDPNSSFGKRYITEVVIKKYLGLKTCLDITGNIVKKGLGYNIIDSDEWGKISVKSSGLLERTGGNSQEWHFGIDKNKKVDFFFLVGYDKKRENIMMFLIVPNEDRVNVLDGLWVPLNARCKWDAFKESVEEVKKLNDIFHSLKLSDCPILRSGNKEE